MSRGVQWSERATGDRTLKQGVRGLFEVQKAEQGTDDHEKAPQKDRAPNHLAGEHRRTAVSRSTSQRPAPAQWRLGSLRLLLSFPRPPFRRLRIESRFPLACEAGDPRYPFLPTEDGDRSRVGPAANGKGRGPARPARRGSERPGDAGGGEGGLPIRFHLVLPLPPSRVRAAWAAGDAAAARQPRFAKPLGAPRPSGTQCAPGPPPRCPRGRSALRRGRPRRSRRGGRPGCQPNLRPQKWRRSPKRRRERISLQTRKCKQKGKGEQRESRRKWLTRNLKKTYLRKTEKLKTRRVQPQMKQEKKKPSLINVIYHVLSVVPVSLLVQSRGIFLSTIL